MKKGLELTSLVGCVVGVACIVVAMIFKGIDFKVFLNPAAATVIFAGTVATVLNAFPGSNLKTLGKLFGVVFNTPGGQADVQIVETFNELSAKARREGLLSLESVIKELGNPFMEKGLGMAIDGMDSEYIAETLELDVEAMEERHAVGASIFSQAGGYAPTLGVMGAVFGLIAAMGHIDDTELMAEAIAAAFIATILGIFTGYVLWNPFANKLKTKSKREAATKRLIIEGILCLSRGESPTMIKIRLSSLLPAKEQVQFSKGEK